jgi:hypothetical protein
MRVARTLPVLAALGALGNSACVYEKSARIESGPPAPWREDRLVLPREPAAHLSVTLRPAEDGGVEATVEHYSNCYAIDVREVPRERVSESGTSAGAYVLAAGLAVTGAVMVGTAEPGKEGVVPAGLGLIIGGIALLGASVTAAGTSRSALPGDTEHRVRSPVSCDRRPVRHASIVLRAGDVVQQAETDGNGHAKLTSLPLESREDTRVFVEGALATDVRYVE